MPTCIVCHLDIEENTDSLFQCSNGHPIHEKCLAEWLLHSQNCPLCTDPYPQQVIVKFAGFMENKEKEKQAILDEEKRKKDIKKMVELTNKILFFKFIEEVEKMIEEKKYEDAFEKLMQCYKEGAIDDKNLKILFLLGKSSFLKGRYDLTINFLFKLVKIKFDYPEGFLYLAKAYEKLGLHDKAKWAYDRVK